MDEWTAGRRILLVAASPSLASSLRRTLTLAGYQVELAAGGPAGLAAAARTGHDVILVDAIDRTGLIRRMRARGAGEGILVLSPGAGVDEVVEALDAGADAYLAKPFARSELLARIHALARRRARTAGFSRRSGDC